MEEADIEIDPAELGLSLQVLFATSRKLLIVRKRRARLPSNEHSEKMYIKDLSIEQRFFEAAVQAYSRAWCRSFATQLIRHIQAREIRDIIYAHVVERIISETTVSKDNDSRTYYSGMSSFWIPEREPDPLPYVLTRAFMGTLFAMEISQIVYETSAFWTMTSDSLQEFFLRGALEPNLVAPIDFIRHLNVNINLTVYRPRRQHSSYVRISKDVEATFNKRIRMLLECRHLKQIKCLRLSVEVHTVLPASDTRFHGALLQVVDELEQLGAKVTLRWCRHL